MIYEAIGREADTRLFFCTLCLAKSSNPGSIYHINSLTDGRCPHCPHKGNACAKCCDGAQTVVGNTSLVPEKIGN
jgi:hypothetical protein